MSTVPILLWGVAGLCTCKLLLGTRFSLAAALVSCAAMLLLPELGRAGLMPSTTLGLGAQWWVVGLSVVALLAAMHPWLLRGGNTALFAVGYGWLAEPLAGCRPAAVLGALLGLLLAAVAANGVGVMAEGALALPLLLPAVIAVIALAAWVWRKRRAWQRHAFTRARSDLTFWK